MQVPMIVHKHRRSTTSTACCRQKPRTFFTICQKSSLASLAPRLLIANRYAKRASGAKMTAMMTRMATLMGMSEATRVDRLSAAALLEHEDLKHQASQ